ncbi:MAG: hypothetical protein COU09_00520 [Candidatus Harrisonbacteria bacterium CG10_big_fil_rev_8_21_14_0_10_44_23]|uniref:Methenyltetrahydrofolate cyclohydrolase n=1 Tax=Candidatus Harrisonbacteria bacterium CG10_big_fil_rev_8_21_14_0_10_44_23 TaxID=1974585 RepID=A0A2H0USI8_9BACT|nr:MAG: hypothetical protein COU09_00520 [Candidatus Harrisonbacteria bacterium CG10_big_fil_rev_8_21_14_0_10_44_23]
MIDGRKIATKVLNKLKKQRAPKRSLVAILVGNDPVSLSFLKQKAKTAKEVGIKFRLTKLPASLSQRQLEKRVERVSKNPLVGGVIVQLPLPKKFDQTPILNAIGIKKDIDGLNVANTKTPAPSVGALEVVLKEVGFDLENKKVVVIGSGLLVGQPIVKFLMSKVKKMTIMNKGGLDRAALQNADLIVSGAGKANLITARDIKKDAIVVDYGYSRDRGKLAGDANVKSLLTKTSYITPTPGGTGPLVVAMLLKNFFEINK